MSNVEDTYGADKVHEDEMDAEDEVYEEWENMADVDDDVYAGDDDMLDSHRVLWQPWV